MSASRCARASAARFSALARPGQICGLRRRARRIHCFGMKTILLILLFGITACGGQPSIIFDNSPEWGMPPEASAQKNVDSKSRGAFSDLFGDSIKTVRVRYFSRASWASEKQVREYIAGALTDKLAECYTFPIWSQIVAQPQIECLIDFTDDYQSKVFSERKGYREGRLVIWHTEACFRDGTGRWWFVNLFDYFHSHHPSGDRRLSHEKAPK